MTDRKIIDYYYEVKGKSSKNYKVYHDVMVEYFDVLKDLERIHEADLSELSPEDQSIKLLMEL